MLKWLRSISTAGLLLVVGIKMAEPYSGSALTH